MAREQKKSEELLDEKDALIMRLQSEKEQMKAEACKLQLQWNEEKARPSQGLGARRSRRRARCSDS